MSVTIKDVAALAGVSASTVSRTCKNSPSISEETKRQSSPGHEAQLGYEPNFQASNLASQNSRAPSALSCRFPPVRSYENSFYLEAIRGISQVCNQRQYISTVDHRRRMRTRCWRSITFHGAQRTGRRLYRCSIPARMTPLTDFLLP